MRSDRCWTVWVALVHGAEWRDSPAALTEVARSRRPACPFRAGAWSRDDPTGGRSQLVQSGRLVSPGPSAGRAVASLPSAFMMNRAGAQNTMWAPSGDQAGVYARLFVNLRTSEPSGRIT